MSSDKTTSMASRMKLTDETPRIPKLMADGRNWVMYKRKLNTLLLAKGLKKHLTRGAPKPTNSDVLETWEINEGIVMHILGTTILDSLYARIDESKPCKEGYDMLAALFESRTKAFKIELKRELMSTHCTENGDIQAHF